MINWSYWCWLEWNEEANAVVGVSG
ncbi:hypothetical protein NC652_001471 [Populus alba x Populus x berolinensis]|uniref:Uncharacterized protein n=1 Tax=Populus alba x Populus x berolinensis TaxID=444605 RepID=A0AAD6RLL6_9ROSI|nr:hypothetical protein NC652_001471 [Populus alba x Populus x berolinensis]KAJ7011087.1 hypothetical protein NC653_001502 [Populus alba x Populus x berolinensis]